MIEMRWIKIDDENKFDHYTAVQITCIEGYRLVLQFRFKDAHRVTLNPYKEPEWSTWRDVQTAKEPI